MNDSTTGHPLIAIIHHSGSGHTTEMARAVATGARSTGARVVEHQIRDEDFKGGRWLNEEVLAELD
ncbi:MAG: hypothetical protein EOP06_22680, partial [Proteobacteria bacterium]